jgi:hypothetical protein
MQPLGRTQQRLGWPHGLVVQRTPSQPAVLAFKGSMERTYMKQWLAANSELESLTNVFPFCQFIQAFYGKGP